MIKENETLALRLASVVARAASSLGSFSRPSVNARFLLTLPLAPLLYPSRVLAANRYRNPSCWKK
ncbi:hypothetical protein HRbin30_02195 [bacterium HR30]|nr:hypothetical protein HRbin30_02195 [bacterium HR30]